MDHRMLIGYKDKTQLELVGHGSGGLDELKQHLTSDKVLGTRSVLKRANIIQTGLLRIFEGP